MNKSRTFFAPEPLLSIGSSLLAEDVVELPLCKKSFFHFSFSQNYPFFICQTLKTHLIELNVVPLQVVHVARAHVSDVLEAARLGDGQDRAAVAGSAKIKS